MGYRTRKFNNIFKRALPILSTINPIPHIDIHFFKKTILIMSSHLCLGLPKGLLPVGLHVKI